MIRIQTNRASQLFEIAAKNLSLVLDGNQQLPVFSYWCKFFGENPDEQEESIRLVDAKIYNHLESKSRVNQLLQEKNIPNVFPATYHCIEDALNHKGRVDIWFIKPSHLSGGRGIEVMSHEKLSTFDLPPYHIVQEGIENIALIGGRKFVVRVYGFLWNKNLYIFDDGFVLVHGPQYVYKSTDYGIQVDHQGYQDAENLVEMRLLSSFDPGNRIMEKASAAMEKIAPILEETLSATSQRQYLILGIDVLVLDDGNLKFIEINAIPNFVHSPSINRELNVPLFEHVMRMVYGLDTNRFQKLDTPDHPLFG